MTLIILAGLRKALASGEHASPSVLREFLAGALPCFWEECYDLAFQLNRGQERPRLNIECFAEDPKRQIRLGMAMIAYREAMMRQRGCKLTMPNASEVLATKPEERLSAPPTASRLSATIHQGHPAGYALIRGMADEVAANSSSLILRDLREVDDATRDDLVLICATDPYLAAMEDALDVRIAMQHDRSAMKRRNVDLAAFDRFCSVDELIATWPNARITS